MWWSLFKLLEYICKHTWYNSSFCPFFPSTHRKSLPTARLAIRKNSAIIAIKAVINDGLGNYFEYLLLSDSLRKNLLETELMMISCIRHFVPGRIQGYYLFSADWIRASIWICMIILLFVGWCWFDPCEYFQLLFYHFLFECS